MASPKYRWAHQQERKRWAPVVAAGEAYCVERVCLLRSRWIRPGSRWHLAHDPTGTVWIGVAHEKCNTSEGAARGNRQRGRQGNRPKPPPARRNPTGGRWVV